MHAPNGEVQLLVAQIIDIATLRECISFAHSVLWFRRRQSSLILLGNVSRHERRGRRDPDSFRFGRLESINVLARREVDAAEETREAGRFQD